MVFFGKVREMINISDEALSEYGEGYLDRVGKKDNPSGGMGHY